LHLILGNGDDFMATTQLDYPNDLLGHQFFGMNQQIEHQLLVAEQ